MSYVWQASVNGSAASARKWRPLLNGEYPPPGPTKLGEARTGIGGYMIRPILVLAAPARCTANGEGERCLLDDGHREAHHYEVRMDR